MSRFYFILLVSLSLSCAVQCFSPGEGLDSIFPTFSPEDEIIAKLAAERYLAKNQDGSYPPLLLIPGLIGSGLLDKLENAQPPLLCAKNTDLAQLWLDPLRVITKNCFLYSMGLNFDNETATYYNNEGVHIEAMDFGGVSGVTYWGYTPDGTPVNTTAYMHAFVTYLETIGYVVGKNLTAAPYDWRRADDPNHWNEAIKLLIEDQYTINGNAPVYILAHSLGNLQFSAFLDTMTQTWIDTYIGGFLSVAAPWSGASLAIRGIVSGFGPIFTLTPQDVADLVRSYGSVVWLVPDSYLGSEPLVVVNETVSYSYYNLQQLWEDIGAHTTAQIYKTTVGSLVHSKIPSVPTYCLYGVGKDTEMTYEYANGLSEQPTTIYYGDGDGTVPIQSLDKCYEFDPILVKQFNLLSHQEIMKDPVFFEYVTDILAGNI